MSPLLLASARGLPARLAAPLSASVVVVALATRWFRHGHDLDLLRCLAFLLTAALVSAVDDPSAETLAAVPFPLAARRLGRLAVAFVAVVPIWLLGLAVAAACARGVPLAGVSLQALGIAVFGIACALGIQRYASVDEPAVVALPAVVGLLLAVQLVPRRWAVLSEQTWGPPWTATQLRWTCVVCIGAGLIAHALVHDAGVRGAPRPAGVMRPRA